MVAFGAEAQEEASEQPPVASSGDRDWALISALSEGFPTQAQGWELFRSQEDPGQSKSLEAAKQSSQGEREARSAWS